MRRLDTKSPSCARGWNSSTLYHRRGDFASYPANFSGEFQRIFRKQAEIRSSAEDREYRKPVPARFPDRGAEAFEVRQRVGTQIVGLEASVFQPVLPAEFRKGSVRESLADLIPQSLKLPGLDGGIEQVEGFPRRVRGEEILSDIPGEDALAVKDEEMLARLREAVFEILGIFRPPRVEGLPLPDPDLLAAEGVQPARR